MTTGSTNGVVTYTGCFSDGMLYDGVIYTGCFSDGRLYDGAVTYTGCFRRNVS